MGSFIELTGDNFAHQIVQFGYFAEQIPECFNADLLMPYLNDLISIVCTGKNQLDKKVSKYTLPTTLSTYKNDISRRIISIPNPKAYMRLVKFISENWSEIKKFAISKNSQSPITYIHQYTNVDTENLNSENVRVSKNSKSDLIDGIKECIKISLGYKYRLKVDIANFYNTIYTHSVSWAICGKDEAKKYMLTKQPIALKNSYDLADKLDTFTTFLKNGETNGIVIGPFTSRIFSEIILARLDKDLKQERFKFRRYVDDYKFYFRSEAQAQESILRIERILNSYNLNLNMEKTEIKRYPYEVINSMYEVYQNAILRDGVFGVLNAASVFHTNGEVGAYKYALKFIQNHVPLKHDLGLVVSELTNIMLMNPKLGKLIVPYLKKIVKNDYREDLTKVYNSELTSSLKNKLQEESLLFIYILRELSLDIYVINLQKIISGNNDLSIIVALDIWKNRRNTVRCNNKATTNINKQISVLADSLNGEKYSGSRWLLLHEIHMHSLIKKTLMPNIEMDDFFHKLSELNISFYHGLGNNT